MPSHSLLSFRRHLLLLGKLGPTGFSSRDSIEIIAASYMRTTTTSLNWNQARVLTHFLALVLCWLLRRLAGVARWQELAITRSKKTEMQGSRSVTLRRFLATRSTLACHLWTAGFAPVMLLSHCKCRPSGSCGTCTLHAGAATRRSGASPWYKHRRNLPTSQTS